MTRSVLCPADFELCRTALAGDRAARERLFERLRCVPRFVAAANRRHGRTLDGGELEDLAQNVLLLVWRKLGEYRGEAAIETWAFRFCLFETLNAVRRARRPERAMASLDTDVDPRELVVHAPVDRGLLEEEFLAIFERLARREAEVVRLRHVQGLELGEIAAMLGISTSSVKTHYYRGVEKLRSHFAVRDGGRPA